MCFATRPTENRWRIVTTGCHGTEKRGLLRPYNAQVLGAMCDVVVVFMF